MIFLKKYRKKYWKLFSIAILFLTFEGLCDLMQPTIMAKIIDIGVAGKQMDYVWRMGGLMLLITALGAVSATLRNIISTNVSQNFGADLRYDLFKHTQELSFANMDRFDRASLITRLTNDVNQVQMFVNGLMRIMVRAPLLCLGSLIMAIRLNPYLASVLAVIVPLVGLLIYLNMKYGFPFFTRVQNALDRVNSSIREFLSGVRVVKAFNRNDYELAKFNRANQDLQSRSTAAMRIMAIFSPSVALTVNMGIVAVIWMGGVKVSSGNMEVGHVIAFINYMTQILFSLMLIAMVFNMFVRVKASATRINEIFSVRENFPVIAPSHAKITGGRVDFENVSFCYQGTTDPVIHSISFSCLPGEVVGIIGSTGSGKTTLVSLLPRFYDATSGSVRINGVDVKELDPKVLREKIAIVPQKTILFTGTIEDNLRWGKEDASFAEMERAARVAQAHDFIMQSPEGYETRVGQGGVNFSGGQKQRLSIARALVRKPEMLILDDSSSAVDVATEARIKEALRKFANEMTCIMIAQRITSIMDADKILVLDNGHMVGWGTHQELLNDCQVYQEIFQSQVGKEVS